MRLLFKGRNAICLDDFYTDPKVIEHTTEQDKTKPSSLKLTRARATGLESRRVRQLLELNSISFESNNEGLKY